MLNVGQKVSELRRMRGFHMRQFRTHTTTARSYGDRVVARSAKKVP